MKRNDRLCLAGLAAFGLFIWLHDFAWWSSPDDTVPLLVALPLAAWLAAPLRLSAEPAKTSQGLLALAGVSTVLGLAAGLNLPLAAGWTAALWAWLGGRLETESRKRVFRLLPLCLLAFPWISLDFPALGWWFRLSAAWAAEQFFGGMGMAVSREGTGLLVAQMPFDVTPACSGLKALQAMLVAGTALCFAQIRQPAVYWPSLAVLPAIAWLANTVRVVVILAAALSVGPEFATGWFHPVGGWIAMGVMFGATWLGLEALRRLRLPVKP